MSRDRDEKKFNEKKLIVVVKCLIEELISKLTFSFVSYWLDILIIENCKNPQRLNKESNGGRTLKRKEKDETRVSVQKGKSEQNF